MLSSSRFSSNSKSGITVNGVIGQAVISDTVVTGNSLGVLVNGTNGAVDIQSTTFLENRKQGLLIGNITGIINLRTVNSSKNHGTGIEIKYGSVVLNMSDCQVENNKGQGLHILHQVNSTLNISMTEIRSSGWDGVYLQEISERSNVWIDNITSNENSNYGVRMKTVTADDLQVSMSIFNRNGIHGVFAEKVTPNVMSFQRVTISNNRASGAFLQRGRSNIRFNECSFVNNNNDGLHLFYQEGMLSLQQCFIDANTRHGLYGSSYARLHSLHIQNSSIINSGEFGIYIVIYGDDQRKNDNYSITFRDCTIANNTQGGIYFSPVCRYRSYELRRHVRLSFSGNKVEGNQKFGLKLQAPEEYELKAVLENNLFKNNTGDSLTVVHGCERSQLGVKIVILSNTFRRNKGERVVFVDYDNLPNNRLAIIKNNTFADNQGKRSYVNSYTRIKAQAVLIVKEGRFTVEGNRFDNPLFSHDVATLLRDETRFVNAEGNWWGSQDECKIKKRIFDFEDRIDLARIQYYPYLDSFGFTNMSFHRGMRPSCFLEGNKIGGILDRDVTLTKGNESYLATGDVIVLSNGTLTIEGNVTVEFPLQAVFFVQGQVLANGTDTERIRFVPFKPSQQGVRLVDGPGPWEGRLELWANNTWMSVCTDAYGRKVLPWIVCRQLRYESSSYSFHRANGEGTSFLYNVWCTSNENDDVGSCNKQRWISKPTCSNFIFYVECKIPHWAGVHLAMTSKKSVIRNLDIIYAGYSYRKDIHGSALRLDFTEHEIRGVYVNNSARLGLHVVYTNPFKANSSDIVNTTITNTISHGIQVESPYLNLMKTDVIKTGGRGYIFLESSQRPINNHAVNLAEPTVRRYINLCSENVTSLRELSIYYYLKAAAVKSRSCQSVVQVPAHYKIGLQLVYHSLGDYSAFQVYSGANTTSSIPWEIQGLQYSNNPLWVSNSSSIVLKSPSHYSSYSIEVHFLLYLVKGKVR